MELGSRLQKVKAFRYLSDAAADALATRAQKVAFGPGETILRTGDPGDSMFVILEGSVEARVSDENGQTRFATCMQKNEVFGEMALLTGEPRSADVVVPDDVHCECALFEKNEIEQLMRQHPAIARFLTEILGERLLRSDSMRELGKYRLLGELGRGGMSRVFEGYHMHLDRSVAVKMLNHSLVFEADFAERFQREAKLIAGLSHPNIVQVYDLAEAYGTWFIVMERLSGTDCDALLAEKGAFTFGRVRSIVRQAAAALACAHDAQIIHRDVKPGNMFLQASGHLKLVDFGIALANEEAADDELTCTPEYVAPEFLVNQGFDRRIDIYSLGLTAWTLLAGRDWAEANTVPAMFYKHITQEVTPIEEVVPDVPDDLAQFIRIACAKKPDARFRDCLEILDVVEEPDEDAERTQLVLSAFVPESQLEDVKQLLAELRESLDHRTGIDSRLAELAPGNRPGKSE